MIISPKFLNKVRWYKWFSAVALPKKIHPFEHWSIKLCVSTWLVLSEVSKHIKLLKVQLGHMDQQSHKAYVNTTWPYGYIIEFKKENKAVTILE